MGRPHSTTKRKKLYISYNNKVETVILIGYTDNTYC